MNLHPSFAAILAKANANKPHEADAILEECRALLADIEAEGAAAYTERVALFDEFAEKLIDELSGWIASHPRPRFRVKAITRPIAA